MHLARFPLPYASRLLLYSSSNRGRGVCVGGGPLPATCLMGGGRGFFGVSAKVCAAHQRSNPCLSRPIASLAATEPGHCHARRRDYGRRTVDWWPRLDHPRGGRHRGRHRRRLRPRRRPPPPVCGPVGRLPKAASWRPPPCVREAAVWCRGRLPDGFRRPGAGLAVGLGRPEAG